MKNILIINAHEYCPFSEGRLNNALVERAVSHLTDKGYEVQATTMKDDYDVDTEVQKHQWADAVILQTPVNWMGVPWSFKKYMDLVYSVGMTGALACHDVMKNPDIDNDFARFEAHLNKHF